MKLLSALPLLCNIPSLAIADHQSTIFSKRSTVSNPENYVDVFTGTEGGGNVFPGLARPFGMVKLGVDVIDSSSGNAYSGYAPDGKISGISMMHESGTGGAPQYGVVAQLPYTDDIDFATELTLDRQSADSGSVGQYQVNFTNGVNVELAAADRSGIYHYSFPSNASAKILVNGSHHLSSPLRPWWSQYSVNGSIEANDDLSQYKGSHTLKGGWGEQSDWTIYYCGDFDTKPTSVTSYQGTNVNENNGESSSTKQDDSFGLVFQFDKSEIKLRVGISFISSDQACSNIKNDFGNDYDTDQTIKDSISKWNDEVFSKFEINTNNNDTLTDIFYSALYGSHLLPSNRTGEAPSWNSDEVYYDDFFTLWDTFRCLNPLFNLINPTRGGEIVQAMTNIYNHDGYTPDGRSANQNGRTQGGSNSDIVMADAYVKNINGIDWDNAYKAMKKNAEVQPPYKYDQFAPDASNQDGRGALPDWLDLGYVTRKYTRSVTRTMEYSYDDYSLSVVAKGLGNSDDHEKYLKRSAGWQHIWNKDASTSKFDYTGFVQPKQENGSWAYDNYDPLSCGGCYWGDDEYEGKPIEYGWSVPWDIETLKNLIGSNDTFVKRLDDMYALYGSEDIVDVGNEPSFLTPYLYNYDNKNYKTVNTIRYIINSKFSNGKKGLPGNSDAGAMQAWYLFGLLGFYPVAGTTTYLLSSPFLPYYVINLENGKKVEVTANNLSSENYFIQSVKINGESWNQNWFDHDDLFKNGGSIEYELGSDQKVWESGDLPPSPGHYTLQD